MHDNAEQEAIRRLRAAKVTGATILDLGDLELSAVPVEIRELSEPLSQNLVQLQPKDSGFRHVERQLGRITDLSSLAGCNNLLSLNLSRCYQLTDVDGRH